MSECLRFDPPLIPCTFLGRRKRFFADVRLADGQEMAVHCPNSGSMRTVALPDRPAWISDSQNPKRKLSHTLEIIEVAEGERALVNTHRPNHLMAAAIQQGLIPSLSGYPTLQTERRYGSRNSRIDLWLGGGERPEAFVEVKNVTLSYEPGASLFPDGVTSRGAKHLEELIDVAASGARAVLLFCVSRETMRSVAPADGLDPHYGQLLRRAAASGVELLAHLVDFGPAGTPQALSIGEAVPVLLPPLEAGP